VFKYKEGIGGEKSAAQPASQASNVCDMNCDAHFCSVVFVFVLFRCCVLLSAFAPVCVTPSSTHGWQSGFFSLLTVSLVRPLSCSGFFRSPTITLVRPLFVLYLLKMIGFATLVVFPNPTIPDIDTFELTC
jgi:hypothetical protein